MKKNLKTNAARHFAGNGFLLQSEELLLTGITKLKFKLLVESFQSIYNSQTSLETFLDRRIKKNVIRGSYT